MVKGSSSSGTGGALVARKERAEGTAYLIVSVYQYRIDRIGILVDILEQKAVESGLITINADAIGRGIDELGRIVLDGLFFDFDKASLQDRSAPALKEIASYLKAHTEQSFYVVGHTDAKGSLNYNINLSRERARSVIDALMKQHSIPNSQLEPQGVGPLSPVFANTSDAGRERNRRVELVQR
jgi:outer membrane protein OmpA-like peptidoglycan-associated protein